MSEPHTSFRWSGVSPFTSPSFDFFLPVIELITFQAVPYFFPPHSFSILFAISVTSSSLIFLYDSNSSSWACFAARCESWLWSQAYAALFSSSFLRASWTSGCWLLLDFLTLGFFGTQFSLASLFAWINFSYSSVGLSSSDWRRKKRFWTCIEYSSCRSGLSEKFPNQRDNVSAACWLVD